MHSLYLQCSWGESALRTVHCLYLKIHIGTFCSLYSTLFISCNAAALNTVCSSSPLISMIQLGTIYSPHSALFLSTMQLGGICSPYNALFSVYILKYSFGQSTLCIAHFLYPTMQLLLIQCTLYILLYLQYSLGQSALLTVHSLHLQ